MGTPLGQLILNSRFIGSHKPKLTVLTTGPE